ncbi:MAG: cytochrome c oxidase subunit II [Dokdonella sp.]
MISSGVQRGGHALAASTLSVGCLVASAAACANPVPWQLNMAPGVTSISQRIYDLHMLGLWVCVGIGVVVFAAMIVAMFRFRKSKGAVAQTWSHSTKLETVWTIIPVIILISMAWPATKLLVDMANVQNSDMTVKITGYQWRWAYDYVDYNKKPTGVHFISSLDADSYKVSQSRSGEDPASVKDGDYSSYLLNVDHPLVLPVGVKVRFVITADDVIHSWGVPALGWKTDAIPGIINDNWTQIDTPGTYRGQCVELCGRGHAYMPIVVKAVPKAEFEQWLAAQAPAPAAAPAPAPAASVATPAAADAAATVPKI